MGRHKVFALRMNADERAALAALAARFERSQSDAIRFVVLKAARQLAEQRDTDAMTQLDKVQTTAMHLPVLKPAVDSMTESTVTSTNQSGGVTAKNVFVLSDIQQTAPTEQSPKKITIWRAIISVSVTIDILASIVQILQYLRITP